MKMAEKCLLGIVAIVASITIAIPANAVPRIPKVVNISGDRGGEVIRYALKMKKLERAGSKVRFRGSCDSACTLYLALPRHQLCITPNAKFRFHLPYGASPRGNRIAADYMRRSYPGWVRSWLRKNGGLSRRLKTMNYSYASKYLQTCKTKRTFRHAYSKRSSWKTVTKLNISYRGAYGYSAGRPKATKKYPTYKSFPYPGSDR